MKKAILILAVAFFSGNQLMAQVDSSSRSTTTTTTTNTSNSRYWYYPESNVYYNESAKTYSYMDPSTNTWTTNANLPSTIVLNKNDRAQLSYNGTDVWKDNAMHQKKYRKAAKKMDKAQSKGNK
jgi:hypothetical protein